MIADSIGVYEDKEGNGFFLGSSVSSPDASILYIENHGQEIYDLVKNMPNVENQAIKAVMEIGSKKLKRMDVRKYEHAKMFYNHRELLNDAQEEILDSGVARLTLEDGTSLGDSFTSCSLPLAALSPAQVSVDDSMTYKYRKLADRARKLRAFGKIPLVKRAVRNAATEAQCDLEEIERITKDGQFVKLSDLNYSPRKFPKVDPYDLRDMSCPKLSLVDMTHFPYESTKTIHTKDGMTPVLENKKAVYAVFENGCDGKKYLMEVDQTIDNFSNAEKHIGLDAELKELLDICKEEDGKFEIIRKCESVIPKLLDASGIAVEGIYFRGNPVKAHFLGRGKHHYGLKLEPQDSFVMLKKGGKLNLEMFPDSWAKSLAIKFPEKVRKMEQKPDYIFVS
jgi:hypothetical protein